MHYLIPRSLAVVALALQAAASTAQQAPEGPTPPFVISLDKPSFTLTDSNTAPTARRTILVAVDTVDGYSFSITATAGQSFSLQQAGAPAASFVASVDDGGETVLEHLVTQALPDGRVNVRIVPLSSSQRELQDYRIARVSAKRAPDGRSTRGGPHPEADRQR